MNYKDLAGAIGKIPPNTYNGILENLILKKFNLGGNYTPELGDIDENINISSISATGTLTRVYYNNAKSEENISIASVTAVGTLSPAT